MQASVIVIGGTELIRRPPTVSSPSSSSSSPSSSSSSSSSTSSEDRIYIVSARTIKYYLGLLTGRPLVAYPWVEACLAAKSLVSYDEFLIHGDKKINDSYERAQLAKRQVSFFAFCFFLWAPPDVASVCRTHPPCLARSSLFWMPGSSTPVLQLQPTCVN